MVSEPPLWLPWLPDPLFEPQPAKEATEHNTAVIASAAALRGPSQVSKLDTFIPLRDGPQRAAARQIYAKQSIYLCIGARHKSR
jgi:hypothetical protein